MYGLTVIEGMSLSGHPSIINKMHRFVSLETAKITPFLKM